MRVNRGRSKALDSLSRRSVKIGWRHGELLGSELKPSGEIPASLPTEAGQVFLNRSEAITREMKNMVNEMNVLTNSVSGGCLLWFPFAGRVYLYVGDGASSLK